MQKRNSRPKDPMNPLTATHSSHRQGAESLKGWSDWPSYWLMAQTLDRSSWFPRYGDPQAPVHPVNQDSPLKFIVVLSEFLSFWTWWARRTLEVMWFKGQNVRSEFVAVWLHSLQPSLLNSHQDSPLHCQSWNTDPFWLLPYFMTSR